MTDRPAGPLVDALGVTIDVRDNQQLTEVLVIGKIADFDSGDTPVVIAKSRGLDWVAQLGLIHAARLIYETTPLEDSD